MKKFAVVDPKDILAYHQRRVQPDSNGTQPLRGDNKRKERRNRGKATTQHDRYLHTDTLTATSRSLTYDCSV